MAAELSKTTSICPECLKTLEASVFERDGRVWIAKRCEAHGAFEDLYWGDYESYKRIQKFSHDGKGIDNPAVTGDAIQCPHDCGLCTQHKTHTALGNVVVTNRCDLTCFYCFFYAKAMGYVYEPTLEQIRFMLRRMREEKPVATNAVQITGGSPEMRDDLLDIIRIAREEGYEHVQLNTNGTRKLCGDEAFAKAVRDAGCNVVYLSFDGVTPKTNPKNHYEIPRILQNCRSAGLGVVLVPTVVRGVNDCDAGSILRFGLKHIDVVRSVNYQPVSLVGRISRADVAKFRITIPDVIEKLAETGIVEKGDFYPIPTVSAITHFVESLTNAAAYELTTHVACGMATYIFMDGDKAIPLPRFVDIDGLVEFLDQSSAEITHGKNRMLVTGNVLYKLGSFVDKAKQPKSIDFARLLFDILAKGSYNALGVFHTKTMFVGMMHFMDKYNYDVERVKRCCVHYAQPDGRIVPFCAFNVIPEWHRDAIQERFSLPIEEWERRNGRKIDSDLYKRDAQALAGEEIYRKTYEGFV
jgi:uncharacterized radical SAM superfamily Fe-S cluster-containing enzyme